MSSVVGQEVINDYLFLYQGTTIGGSYKNNKLYYPIIGNYVLMYPDSKVLCDSIVRNNVVFSANEYCLNEIIPDNCIVFGQSFNLIIKRKTKNEILSIMARIWEI